MTGRSASSRDLLQQLDAIGARQHQVEQDQLGAVSPVLPHRDGRPAGAGRPPAGRGERVPHVAQRLRVVVDHEDARLLLHLVGGAGAAQSDSGRGAVGLVNHRNREGDLRPVACAGALGPDAAPVGLDQPLADGQAQAVSPAAQLPVVAGEAGVLPEQVRQLLRRHAPALVGHRDRDVNGRPAPRRRGWGSSRGRAAPRWRRGCLRTWTMRSRRPVPILFATPRMPWDLSSPPGFPPVRQLPLYMAGDRRRSFASPFHIEGGHARS